MIKGRTVIKRDIVNFPRGEVKIGSIPADTEITASENIRQWLHLVEGGWVNAGAKQQYIQWDYATDSVEPEPEAEDPAPAAPVLIKGITIIKRDIVDAPYSEVKIGRLPAGIEITANENSRQWLHLVEGGWVNAGAKQQYIQWEYVPASTTPDPVEDGPLPSLASRITDIKRKGRIATLLVDWQNPKWHFEPRQINLKGAYPHTVTFNAVPNNRKGPRVPLKPPVLEHLERLNGARIAKRILQPQAGWINRPTTPPSCERLTWAGNHVVVREVLEEEWVKFANVYAMSCHEKDLEGTFFDKDMRLVIHKFNASTWNRNMIKLAGGEDCYTPFITAPNVNDGAMWIRLDYLELWPRLPFALSDGTEIVEYELHGFEICGLRADGSSVLLREPGGFKTNWSIASPEVPY